jgi:hypothetical protein
MAIRGAQVLRERGRSVGRNMVLKMAKEKRKTRLPELKTKIG